MFVVDKAFIEAIIAPVGNNDEATKSLLDLDAFLFNGDLKDIRDRLAVNYDFKVTGQANAWAMTLIEHLARLDRLITVVVAEIYRGRYSVFTDRGHALNIFCGLTFESIMAGSLLVQALPYLYEDFEIPKDFQRLPDLMYQYADEWRRFGSPEMKKRYEDFPDLMDTPQLNNLTFYPMMELLPPNVVAHNPITTVQVDVSLNYLPVLTMGSAISEFIHHTCGGLKQIAMGGRMFIDAHSKEVREMISTALNCITYVGAEVVFLQPCSRALVEQGTYNDLLIYSDIPHSRERMGRYNEMIISMGSSWNSTIPVSLSRQ